MKIVSIGKLCDEHNKVYIILSGTLVCWNR